MRVSSGMIFDAGVAGINRQTAAALHLQQQVSSGRRILTPSDDPVSAARALEVTQASDMVAQFKQNQDYATSALAMEEGQLSSAGDVLARVRELTLQAGNTNLSATARKGIATELRSRFDELLGIANSTDGAGTHIFAGFMGSTEPFGGSVDNLIAGNEIVYQGDDGQRKMQVSPNRFIEVSDSGSEVFRRITNGNGYFSADYAAGNTGTGRINAGSVTNPAAWSAGPTRNVTVNFTDTAGVISFDLLDASGVSLLTASPAPAPLGVQRVYQAGQPIILKSQGAESAFDLGASISISGAPADGDSFSIAPATSQSVFATISKLIGALETPAGTPAANAQYSSEISFAIAGIDQASDNVLRVRARIGSRMNEIDSLASLNESLGVQYQQTLSGLQDLDYAKAITDLTRKLTDLQAAQQSYAKMSQLSLFNYL